MAALLLAAVLAALAGLHAYWALGGAWAAEAVVPTRPDGEPVFRPRPVETWAVAALLLLAVATVLAAAGLVRAPVPEGWARVGVWVLASVLLLRAVGEFRYVGFTKRVRGTAFARWDTRLYSPLCLGMAGLAAGVALG